MRVSARRRGVVVKKSEWGPLKEVGMPETKTAPKYQEQ